MDVLEDALLVMFSGGYWDLAFFPRSRPVKSPTTGINQQRLWLTKSTPSDPGRPNGDRQRIGRLRKDPVFFLWAIRASHDGGDREHSLRAEWSYCARGKYWK